MNGVNARLTQKVPVRVTKKVRKIKLTYVYSGERNPKIVVCQNPCVVMISSRTENFT